MSHIKNIEMISIVATGLKDIKNDVVFVGGATAGFYIDIDASEEIRPTEDVDCIIEMATRKDYYQLEKKLRNLGFSNKLEGHESMICRWIFSGVTVDIMPVKEKILNFTNKWYEEGIRNHKTVKLNNEIEVRIFSLPYFLASKIEAFMVKDYYLG